MAKARKAAKDEKAEDRLGINVRGLPREYIDHLKKWSKKEEHTKSAGVRLFIRKCLQHCDDFTWDEFMNAKIIKGGERVPEIPEPDDLED